MSKIEKASEEVKKKLSFSDFNPLKSSDVKKRSARKLYIIANKDMSMLEEIFSKRKQSSSMTDLMSEAIQLLYQKEFYTQ